MSTNDAATAARPTYGNWAQQKSPGVMGAGFVATVVLLGGLVFSMGVFIFLQSFPTMLVMLAVTGVAFGLLGTPAGPWLVRRIGFAQVRNRGEHQWRSGVFSRNAPVAEAAAGTTGVMRLPGTLGRTNLLEKTDPFGSSFAVIKNPLARGLYTIVARCVADGPGLQDQERIDGWVAGWSQVLSHLGQDPGLVGVKAICDTAPDPGGRLSTMVGSMMDPGAPQLARDVMDACVAGYPSASSENVTYIELTYRGRLLNRRNDETAILSELARRVPQLVSRLGAAGGGAVSMVTAAALPQIVYTAYDPAAQPWIEQAEAAGHPQVLEWGEAGPVAYQETWDRLTHDSGISVTWELSQAPRSVITEMGLSHLIAPHRDFTRKRVALLYRPMTPDRAVTSSERDANAAIFLSSQSKKRTTAQAKLRMQATDRSRLEVATGATLTPFSILITGTVTDVEDLDQAVATMESNAGAASMRIRRAWGSQAAAFATTLPAGVVPWEHTVIPTRIREYL
ncbi:SCO6880 family protein [Nocardioides alkalitolerans]|uniref:SCO6880 family protein n=1 Tax=Nocardioides alkalitolerans TaxID=281714 RepID=UPI000401B8F2|nr:SCO6880 family protein [Nocardioides alkalitolerans]